MFDSEAHKNRFENHDAKYYIMCDRIFSVYDFDFPFSDPLLNFERASNFDMENVAMQGIKFYCMEWLKND